MKREHQIQGIVLKQQKIYEHDTLVDLFSPEEGKLKVRVKSGGKRWAGHIQVTHLIQVSLYNKGSIPLVTSCDVVNTFINMRQSFNHLSMAAYFINIIAQSTSYQQKNKTLFELLIATFNALETRTDILTIKHEFEHKFLESEGLLTHKTNSNQFQKTYEDYVGKCLAQPLLIE